VLVCDAGARTADALLVAARGVLLRLAELGDAA
jgi:hypothetical protein